MIFFPKKEIIKYQFIFNLLIELIILIVASTIFYLKKWDFYLIACLIFLISSLINFLNIKWYVKNATITITKKTIRLSKGKLFTRKAYIPNNKIYMLYKKNNYLMEKLGITTLEVRTLAKNYEIIGLSVNDAKTMLNHFDKDNNA